MDRGAWWAAVRGAAKSQICLVTEHSTAHTSIKKREKDPRSKFSPILGYQGLGLQHLNLEPGEKGHFLKCSLYLRHFTHRISSSEDLRGRA